MQGPTSDQPTDFARVIDLLQVVPRLRSWHLKRMGIGLIGASLVVGYNLLRAPGADVPGRLVGLALSGLFAISCVVALLVGRHRFQARLAEPCRSLRDEVQRIYEVVNAREDLLLLLAAIGHGVVVVGTFFKLRLFHIDGEILLLALMPTVLLLLRGIFDVPTRERLERLRQQSAGVEAG